MPPCTCTVLNRRSGCDKWTAVKIAGPEIVAAVSIQQFKWWIFWFIILAIAC